MAAPKATVWPLDPHTRAKHEILQRYLQAWTPILTQGGFPEVMYVDGFAGLGRYSEGEDGSPVIALRVALEQNAQIGATIRFLFIEKNEERAGVLREIVDDFDTPPNFQTQVSGGVSFEEVFSRVLDTYNNTGRPLPPTFAFVDPFGWSGVPFSIVREIMSHRSCEVLVNFMYEEINRFLGHPDQEEKFRYVLWHARLAGRRWACRASSAQSILTRSIWSAIAGRCWRQVRSLVRDAERARCRRLPPVLCDEQHPRTQEDEGGHVEGRSGGRIQILGCHRSQSSCPLRKRASFRPSPTPVDRCISEGETLL